MIAVLQEQSESLKQRLFDLTDKLHESEKEVIDAKQQTSVHYSGLLQAKDNEIQRLRNAQYELNEVQGN